MVDRRCREVLAVIQCYVDGECDVLTMLAIAAHLDACGACTDELESLRWLKAAVRRCAGASGADAPRRSALRVERIGTN